MQQKRARKENKKPALQAGFLRLLTKSSTTEHVSGVDQNPTKQTFAKEPQRYASRRP